MLTNCFSRKFGRCHFRLWLPRDIRLVWAVLEDEQVVDLLYVGPESSDLYRRMGLDRLLPKDDV
jgi:hypothetical protein